MLSDYRKGNKGKLMIDLGTEKKQCLDEYENGGIVMSDDKCKDCEHKYECRFMQKAMDEIIYGSDWKASG